MGDFVTWDSREFCIISVGIPVCGSVFDIEMRNVFSKNEAIIKIEDERKKKEEKKIKLAQLKEMARGRRRVKKEKEMEVIKEVEIKSQSAIGSLEL